MYTRCIMCPVDWCDLQAHIAKAENRKHDAENYYLMKQIWENKLETKEKISR